MDLRHWRAGHPMRGLPCAERLPGIQITRRNGEGESVQIRGLSANFTRLEIDGRCTSSSFQRADPSREAAMSIFSADLYDTIERRDLANERVENNRSWGLLSDAMLADPEAQANLSDLRFPRRVRYLRQTGETRKLNLAGRLEVVATPGLTLYLHGLHTEEAREEDRSRLQVTFADGVMQEGTRTGPARPWSPAHSSAP